MATSFIILLIIILFHFIEVFNCVDDNDYTHLNQKIAQYLDVYHVNKLSRTNYQRSLAIIHVGLLRLSDSQDAIINNIKLLSTAIKQHTSPRSSSSLSSSSHYTSSFYIFNIINSKHNPFLSYLPSKSLYNVAYIYWDHKFTNRDEVGDITTSYYTIHNIDSSIISNFTSTLFLNQYCRGPLLLRRSGKFWNPFMNLLYRYPDVGLVTTSYTKCDATTTSTTPTSASTAISTVGGDGSNNNSHHHNEEMMKMLNVESNQYSTATMMLFISHIHSHAYMIRNSIVSEVMLTLYNYKTLKYRINTDTNHTNYHDRYRRNNNSSSNNSSGSSRIEQIYYFNQFNTEKERLLLSIITKLGYKTTSLLDDNFDGHTSSTTTSSSTSSSSTFNNNNYNITDNDHDRVILHHSRYNMKNNRSNHHYNNNITIFLYASNDCDMNSNSYNSNDYNRNKNKNNRGKDSSLKSINWCFTSRANSELIHPMQAMFLKVGGMN